MNPEFDAVVSLSIQAPVAQVWDALINPQKIAKYMFGSQVTSDWKAGSPITWAGQWQGKAYEDRGTILEIRPPFELVLTHFSPLAGLPDVPENYHRLHYRLEAEGNATRLSLTQGGNRSADEKKHSEGNWALMLQGIQKLVTS